MNERAEQSYLIMDRGITMLLSPETTRQVVRSSFEGKLLPISESLRLGILADSPIMKKRFPSIPDGQTYMLRVDLEWRGELYQRVEQMADIIAKESLDLGYKEIAVLLFGSVARGLSRNKNDEDPSNVDMAVIADFQEEDKLELYDRMRSHREIGGREIGSNIGVCIQEWEKLRKSNYSTAIEYIGAATRVLYDPAEKWQALENEVFAFICPKKMKGICLSVIRGLKRSTRGCLNGELYKFILSQRFGSTLMPQISAELIHLSDSENLPAGMASPQLSFCLEDKV